MNFKTFYIYFVRGTSILVIWLAIIGFFTEVFGCRQVTFVEVAVSIMFFVLPALAIWIFIYADLLLPAKKRKEVK